jgi:hypothetical protein
VSETSTARSARKLSLIDPAKLRHEADASFAEAMGNLGVNLERTSTGLAPRGSPSGWTWHHAPELGRMELVPRFQHESGSIWQELLHPGGRGGYPAWGR